MMSIKDVYAKLKAKVMSTYLIAHVGFLYIRYL